MRRHLGLLVLALGALSIGLAGSSVAASGDPVEVKASAKFTVHLGDQTATFSFVQSRITKSLLDWTPQVPVSLHASPKSDFLKEFVLAGRVKKGKQKTSEAVALGLNVTVGNQAMLLDSTDGGCTVNVKTLTRTRIAGSFTCNTTYGGEPLTAKGTFKAQ